MSILTHIHSKTSHSKLHNIPSLHQPHTATYFLHVSSFFTDSNRPDIWYLQPPPFTIHSNLTNKRVAWPYTLYHYIPQIQNPSTIGREKQKAKCTSPNILHNRTNAHTYLTNLTNSTKLIRTKNCLIPNQIIEQKTILSQIQHTKIDQLQKKMYPYL